MIEGELIMIEGELIMIEGELPIIENIMQTALMFTFIFVGIIKFHGNNEVSFRVKGIEITGVMVSLSVFLVSMLILIWSE